MHWLYPTEHEVHKLISQSTWGLQVFKMKVSLEVFQNILYNSFHVILLHLSRVALTFYYEFVTWSTEWKRIYPQDTKAQIWWHIILMLPHTIANHLRDWLCCTLHSFQCLHNHQDTLMTLVLLHHRGKHPILPDYVAYVIASIFYKFLPYDTLLPHKDCGDISTMNLWHRVKIERKYNYKIQQITNATKFVYSDLPQSSSLLKIIFQIILYLSLPAFELERPTDAPWRKTFILPDYIASKVDVLNSNVTII